MERSLKKRVTKNLLATLFTPGGECFAYVHDLSGDGLGFTCNRKFNVGTRMNLKLNVPDGAAMDLTGQTVWTRTLPSMSKYRYQYGLWLTEQAAGYQEYVRTLFRKEQDRRQSPRYKAMLEIRNEDVLELLHAATEDVSTEGFYIRTGRPLIVGDDHVINLSLSELEPPVQCRVEVMAVFACEQDHFHLPYGAGVRILSFVGSGEERFNEYIRRLKGLYQYNYYLQTSSSTFGQAFA